MKNFNIEMIKQISVAASSKKSIHRMRKAKKEYKEIKKLIYSTAKHGNFKLNIEYISFEPEVYTWLKEEGFNVEHTKFFSHIISWDI